MVGEWYNVLINVEIPIKVLILGSDNRICVNMLEFQRFYIFLGLKNQHQRGI